MAFRLETDAGSDSTVTAVWARGGNVPAVYVEYSTGLHLVVSAYDSEEGSSKQLPEEMFRDLGLAGKKAS